MNLRRWSWVVAVLLAAFAHSAPLAAQRHGGGHRSTSHGAGHSRARTSHYRASSRGYHPRAARAHHPRAARSYHPHAARAHHPRAARTPHATRARSGASHGKIKRSSSARHEFMRQTGYPHGRKGYVIDHVVPLACGGADAPSNMQWQSVADAKAKDRVERRGCGHGRRR